MNNINTINTINKINIIQTEETRILKKILDKVLFNAKEKELISKIITSFIDINKRFEAIKVKQLSEKQQKNINGTLTKYLNSIKTLETKVNAL